MHSVFSEFALLLLMAASAGAVSLWLRQPILIAYIVIGIIAARLCLVLSQHMTKSIYWLRWAWRCCCLWSV